MNRVRRMGQLSVIVVIGSIIGAPSVSAQDISVGGFGGADISTLKARWVLGVEVAWQFAPTLRVRAAGSEVEGHPSSHYAGATLEWQPMRSRVHPYVGAGGAFASVPGRWSYQNHGSWLVLGGVEAVTKFGTPYLEMRVHGIQGTSEHVVVGWRMVP